MDFVLAEKVEARFCGSALSSSTLRDEVTLSLSVASSCHAEATVSWTSVKQSESHSDARSFALFS